MEHVTILGFGCRVGSEVVAVFRAGCTVMQAS